MKLSTIKVSHILVYAWSTAKKEILICLHGI